MIKNNFLGSSDRSKMFLMPLEERPVSGRHGTGNDVALSVHHLQETAVPWERLGRSEIRPPSDGRFLFSPPGGPNPHKRRQDTKRLGVKRSDHRSARRLPTRHKKHGKIATLQEDFDGTPKGFGSAPLLQSRDREAEGGPQPVWRPVPTVWSESPTLS